MTTMRRQVAIALLLTMLLAWTTVFAIRYNEIRRPGTGILDTNMRDGATQALMSIPVGLLAVPAADSDDRFDPAGPDPRVSEKAFQAWALADRRAVIRSARSPATPMVPGFRDGFHDVVLNGEPWRVYAVSDADGRIQLQFGKSLKQLRREADERMADGAVFLTLLFVILAAVTYWVMRRAFRPVDRARESIRNRPDMDLAPLPTAGMPGELQPFIASINLLLARLSASLEGERRFLADAAHELRTPLAAMSTYAELVAGSQCEETRRQAAARLRDVASRTTRLVEQLLDHARVERLCEQPTGRVDLAALVEMIVRDCETLAARRQQRIGLDAGPAAVRGELDALGVLLRNLLDNALRYTPPGGRVEAGCETLSDGTVRLRIADNGPGIDPAERERVFDRFYRIAGNEESGSGIGLSLVSHIAATHGARIDWCEGLDGRGIGLTVTFPAPHPGHEPGGRNAARPSAALTGLAAG